MWIIQILYYVTLKNTAVRTSLHEKHLGNFISNNIHDRNIKEHVYRLIGKTNANSCDFGCCDSSTLVNIHELVRLLLHVKLASANMKNAVKLCRGK